MRPPLMFTWEIYDFSEAATGGVLWKKLFLIVGSLLINCLNLIKESIKEQLLTEQMFFEIGVLENFAIIRKKHLCWSVFLIKLQACNLSY